MFKSDDELRTILTEQIKDAGSQRNLAKRFGFSGQFINDVVHGRRNMTEAMAAALGYRRTERIWEPVATEKER